MASFGALPSWVEISKQKVQKTEEWVNFSKDLFDIVSSHMQENGVRSFNMLSLEEKKTIVLKAVTALQAGSSYKDLFNVVSSALDYELGVEMRTNNNVEKSVSKSDSLSQECRNAVEAILNKWPDAKIHFLQCLNATLSIEMRNIIWKAQLQNSAVKQDYLKLVESSPKRLVSKLDLEISQKCQVLLQSDATLQALREMKSATSVLRHLLSYHHARSNLPSGLAEIEYLVAVPFVFTALSPVMKARQTKKNSSLSSAAIASLIEQYDVFWNNRPDYVKSLQKSKSLEAFSGATVSILRRMDADLVNHLSDLHTKMFRTADHASELAVADLFQPLLRCFFVSYLPLDTVMFIFDQIVIGFHTGLFDPLPYFCASLLFLHEKDIKSRRSWREMESKFRSHLLKQGFESLQGLFKEFKFSRDLRTILEEDIGRRNLLFPVMSSSVLSNLPPWRHWSSEKLKSHFLSAKNSRVMKSTSSATQLGLDDAPAQEGLEKGSVTELKAERDDLVEEIHLMRQELVEAKKQIKVEQMATLDVQERADFEIERLRRQLSYLQQKNSLTPPPLLMASKLDLTEPQYENEDSSSFGSAHAPPPTEATNPKTPIETPSPVKVMSASSPSKRASLSSEEIKETLNESEKEPLLEPKNPQSPTLSATAIFRDLADLLMGGVNAIAHGTAPERKVLNEQTKSDLVNVKKAYELAKVQVFGKPMTEEEIENLPEAAKQKLLIQLGDATKDQLLKLKVGKT